MKPNIEVPESIPLSKVRAFVADLGIDPTYLREFHCGMDGVYVEVAALNANGRLYMEPGASEVAMHRIAIPLDRDA